MLISRIMWHRLSMLSPLVLSAATVFSQTDCTPVDTLVLTDSWQTVSGSYPEGGSVTYAVTLELGANHIFKTGCGDGATADHDTRIELVTPTSDCMMMMQDDNGCEDGRSLLFNTFFDGINLRIRVSGAQGEGGTFTMAYRTLDGEPGQCNECPSYDEDLSPSSLWQTVNGSYAAEGCRVYRVFGTPGLEYTFKTGCGDGATANADTRLELFQAGWPDCTSLTTDDNGCEEGRSTVTWTPPPGNATIYVKVSGADALAGDFTLAYRASGGNGSVCGPCTAYDHTMTPGPNWLNRSSSYLPGGCQVYRVFVDGGFNYTFKTGCGNGASADHDTYLELFNDTCGLLASNDSGCDSLAATINYFADSSTILFLRVSGAGGVGGFFNVAARKSGTCSECPAFDDQLTPNLDWQTDSGSYWANGCRTYKVNVLAGHSYVFQTAYGHGASADHQLDIDLLDANCAPTAQGAPWPSYSSNRRFLLADSTGTAYLQVHGVDNDYGSYVMAYRDLGAASDLCQDAEPIELGYNATVQLSGNLADATSTGDFPAGSAWEGLPVKWYALDMSDDCYSLLVSYCGQAPAWQNTLNIVTDSCGGGNVWTAGPFQWESCQDGNAQYFFQIQPGLYYLPLLYDTTNPGNGNYTIALSCGNMIIDAIKEPAVARWTLLPNPGQEGFWIQATIGAMPATAHVQVVDLLGRTVLDASIPSSRAWVGMDEVPTGVYVIRVEEATGVTSLRWVKQ